MKVKYIRGGKLKLKGSALKVSLLNEIIQNTKIPVPLGEIHDGNNIYYLDTKISTRVVRVYYSPVNRHCIISHSSTIINPDD